jgi:hypothetical protein
VTDRLLARVEALSNSIRKLKIVMDSHPADHPNMARWKARMADYLTSIRNIQEHGRETLSAKPEGVKIEVPTDVMTLVKGS